MTNRLNFDRFTIGILLAIVGLTGCFQQFASKTSEREPAESSFTSVADLKKKLGEPVQIRPSETNPRSVYMDFANQQSCEIENERVLICYRSPRPDEMTLTYWRELWRGVEQNYEQIEEHGVFGRNTQFKLTAPSLKLGVVYSPVEDRIVQVLAYGKPVQ